MLYGLVSRYSLVQSFTCSFVHSFIQETLEALCIPVTAFCAVHSREEDRSPLLMDLLS